MDVRNCKGCGKLFNYLSGPPLCPNCLKALDTKFSEVKEYIYEHPGAGIQEVSEENEVSIAQIKKWIREERLSFADDSPIGVECEGCGKTIKTGRYCPLCKDKMTHNLGEMYKEAPKKQVRKIDKTVNPKMRFFDN